MAAAVKNSRKIYISLLHHPMVNKNGDEVTTSVTNLDIHDIARSAKTFGVDRYYIVNPEPDQQKIVARILGHWHEEVSKVYHPKRAEALNLVQYAFTFEEVCNEILKQDGQAPFVVMPDAKPLNESWTYAHLRKTLENQSLPGDNEQLQPLMIVFGTGWGIAPRFYSHIHKPLEPILGTGTYNHLSVRAAAAIILSRLFG